jgi:glutathione peroxidase
VAQRNPLDGGARTEFASAFAITLSCEARALEQLGTPRGHTMKARGVSNVRTGFVALAVLLMAASVYAASSVYDFTLDSIDGKPAPIAAYKGKVLLLVNVASRCGFTPQYSALEAIYEKYKDQGFVILGFPANNFGGQEPGTNAEIKTFCTSKYQVTFPMYSKVSVKGDDQTPLYHFLTTDANPSLTGEIKWNFTKFLVDRDGKVVQRFEPATKPDSAEVTGAIEKALK